jgi:23S rRNA maturation-related 3'-5' exoribonuclease YhaM
MKSFNQPKKEVNTTPKKLKPAELAKVFENIIMTKDAQAIQDLLRKMGAGITDKKLRA